MPTSEPEGVGVTETVPCATYWLYTNPDFPSITTAVQSPLVPVMVRALPLLYSPRMEALMDAPLRKRTLLPLM